MITCRKAGTKYNSYFINMSEKYTVDQNLSYAGHFYFYM